jgi:hypothetical protein
VKHEAALWWWDQLTTLGYDITPVEVEHRAATQAAYTAEQAARAAAEAEDNESQEDEDQEDEPGADEQDCEDCHPTPTQTTVAGCQRAANTDDTGQDGEHDAPA